MGFVQWPPNRVNKLRGDAITFDEVLDEVREPLHHCGRGTYRSLKLRYSLDEEVLARITDELLKAERVAADESGEVLVCG
jgi:hypothetical protein